MLYHISKIISISTNKIVLKIIKMPLLKAFVCQVFGFVLYNYLLDPLLNAKLLPENIANPVLAAVIAFLCFLFQLYTDKSEDGKKTVDSLEKEDIQTSPPVEKEMDTEVKSTMPLTRAPQTEEDMPAAQKPTPVEIVQEVEVLSAGKETSQPIESQDSATVEVEISSSEMIEIHFDQKLNNVIPESTIIADLDANVPIKTAIGDEIISPILSESLNKKSDEITLDQLALSSAEQQSITSPIMQETPAIIEKTNNTVLASEFLFDKQDIVSRTIETSLDTEIIKNGSVDVCDVTNTEQMRKPLNKVESVTESLNMTITEQVLHTEEMNGPKPVESKEVTLNELATEPTLSSNENKLIFPIALEEKDSELKNEEIINGIMPEAQSLDDKGSQEILKPSTEQSNIVDLIVPNADSCDEIMEAVTQSKSKELALEDISVPEMNGIIPKLFHEELSEKSTIFELLNDTPAETSSTFDTTPKGEINIMKLTTQAETNDDIIVALADNSIVLHDEINKSTSNEKINEDTKEVFESNSAVIEFSTKENYSAEIVMENREDKNIFDNPALLGQEALSSTVIKPDEGISSMSGTIITDDEKALLTGIETSNIPEKGASTVSEKISKTQSASKFETTALDEMMYLEKPLLVDVTFLYSCLPQNFQNNNSCDNCIVLDPKKYNFKFLDE